MIPGTLLHQLQETTSIEEYELGDNDADPSWFATGAAVSTHRTDET